MTTKNMFISTYFQRKAQLHNVQFDEKNIIFFESVAESFYYVNYGLSIINSEASQIISVMQT